MGRKRPEALRLPHAVIGSAPHSPRGFMDFDFDTPLELWDTHSSKFDNIPRVFGTDDRDVIPMWVADMDFAAAPAIKEALRAEIERGYFGYYANTSPVDMVVADWLKDRHGWEIDPSWVRYTHGVISGFGDVLATYSEPADGVILFAPVYHAFYRQIEAMGREVVESLLKLVNGRYEMDLDALGAALKGHEKVVVLCSPHNPGGRIWSAEELRQLAEFCAAHDLILISDEIHMDLTFPGHAHVPTCVAAPDHIDRIVVLTAASKGFNLAGGETGLLIAPDKGIRTTIDKTILDRESSPNRFGIAMTRAAFESSRDWLDALRVYLAGNFDIWKDRVGAIPGVSVMDMHGTYLSWVDFTGTGMEDAEIKARILNDAKIAASPGTQFGTGGSGHMRFNLALPRATMMTAIERLEAAFSDLQ